MVFCRNNGPVERGPNLTQRVTTVSLVGGPSPPGGGGVMPCADVSNQSVQILSTTRKVGIGNSRPGVSLIGSGH